MLSEIRNEPVSSKGNISPALATWLVHQLSYILEGMKQNLNKKSPWTVSPLLKLCPYQSGISLQIETLRDVV
jgi:hypothetical protein